MNNFLKWLWLGLFLPGVALGLVAILAGILLAHFPISKREESKPAQLQAKAAAEAWAEDLGFEVTGVACGKTYGFIGCSLWKCRVEAAGVRGRQVFRLACESCGGWSCVEHGEG